ncbi:MAG TPA: FlgD immunoglobulin-like domain containing protein, partial [bacterium]|nr:FlgD immunoglobulin-like domain containing protein [bacterium]
SEEVRIAYETPERGAVRVTVHDVAGRRVAVLRNGPRPPGFHREVWDGRGEDGARAAAGLYVVRVELGGRTAARRFVRLR